MKIPTDAERAAYYRERASQVRMFAEGELNSSLRSALLDIACQYEKLADELEKGRVKPAG